MTEDTNTVRLSYKDYEFEVTVDLDTYNKINNDEVYKNDFARQTYESLESDGHFIGDDDGNGKIEALEDDIDLDIKPRAPSFKWSKPAIDHLVKLRFSKNDLFNSPKTRKSDLWHAIAVTLGEKFPGITAEMCDAKYRNLVHTYKLNKQRECRYGVETVKWEYFQLFDKNLGLRLRLPEPGMDCLDSLVDESVDTSRFLKEDLLMLESPPPSPPGKSKKYTRDLRLTQYLRIRAENDALNMKLKARIWKEKKQIKEREIAAILQLAKALKNKK
ncbi:unnamed protein product [Plutella xylostella]|uniref:(diamondback moth) hypothetical protein n=1 Tax=Plutella xylostella TaxID=51655 RepID=A0A8S4GHW9_PLUXY|nr:unnamed protein product [Plutella xylostella]